MIGLQRDDLLACLDITFATRADKELLRRRQRRDGGEERAGERNLDEGACGRVTHAKIKRNDVAFNHKFLGIANEQVLNRSSVLA